jgi:hypothetical protein
MSNVKKVPETDPTWPQCMCCADQGLVGGPKHGHEYRFCLCPAGERRKLADPLAVDESNAIAAKLLAL